MTELWAQVDAKFRIDARRSANRLQKAGSLRLERTGSLEPLFKLHRARWEQRNEAGVLAEQGTEDFHREVARSFDARGMLRSYTLSLDEKTLAAIYAFTHRGRCYTYLSGFDPQFAKLSPGVMLLAHLIDEALEEGVTEIDFLRGSESYKYLWGASDRQTWGVRVNAEPESRAAD